MSRHQYKYHWSAGRIGSVYVNAGRDFYLFLAMVQGDRRDAAIMHQHAVRRFCRDFAGVSQ